MIKEKELLLLLEGFAKRGDGAQISLVATTLQLVDREDVLCSVGLKLYERQGLLEKFKDAIYEINQGKYKAYVGVVDDILDEGLRLNRTEEALLALLDIDSFYEKLETRLTELA